MKLNGPLRVLVCGGRDFGVCPFSKYDDPAAWTKAAKEQSILKSNLDYLLTKSKIEVIIHGGAKGADSLAGVWAKENNIRVEVYKADWERYGKKAGILRNEEMLKLSKPSLVIAFRGGRGTADMKRRSRFAGVPVVEI